MATKKRGAPAPRPRSGWVSEDDRKTERLTLRLDPETMTRLRAMAEGFETTIAEVVKRLVKEASK